MLDSERERERERGKMTSNGVQRQITSEGIGTHTYTQINKTHMAPNVSNCIAELGIK